MIKQHRYQIKTVGILLATICFAGCSEKMIDVNGVVLLDGKPVAEAAVMLHPVNGGPTAYANTDANGQFRIKTGNQIGVKPGKYNVTVVKKEILGAQASTSKLSGPPVNIKEKWITPERYANPATSGLSVDVRPGMTALQLDLTSN